MLLFAWLARVEVCFKWWQDSQPQHNKGSFVVSLHLTWLCCAAALCCCLCRLLPQEEQRELANTIRVSGSILLSTVSNFLDFFK